MYQDINGHLSLKMCAFLKNKTKNKGQCSELCDKGKNIQIKKRLNLYFYNSRHFFQGCFLKIIRIV